MEVFDFVSIIKVLTISLLGIGTHFYLLVNLSIA